MLGLRCCEALLWLRRAFLYEELGSTPAVVRRRLLAAASPAVEHRSRVRGLQWLSPTVSGAELPRLWSSSCSTRASLLCGIGTSLDQATNPHLLHWQADSFQLSHQGNTPVFTESSFFLKLSALLGLRRWTSGLAPQCAYLTASPELSSEVHPCVCVKVTLPTSAPSQEVSLMVLGAEAGPFLGDMDSSRASWNFPQMTRQCGMPPPCLLPLSPSLWVRTVPVWAVLQLLRLPPFSHRGFLQWNPCGLMPPWHLLLIPGLPSGFMSWMHLIYWISGEK